MIEAQLGKETNEGEDALISKADLLKYLHYWPWFFISLLIALIASLLYLRYSPTIFATEAKIRIIDENKQLDLASDVLSPFAMYSKVNLDNEMEVIKSHRLLAQVVDELALDIAYYDKGTIKTREIWAPPFIVSKSIPEDSIPSALTYKIQLTASDFLIEDPEGEEYVLAATTESQSNPSLPFTITLRNDANINKYLDDVFLVMLFPKEEALINLVNNLQVYPTNKKAEILTLAMQGESPERSEDILNVVIDKFNEDGILDRQQISKRTLGFIDERFVYLSGQLDSIEAGKQDFKRENNLTDIDEDVTFTLRRKSIAEDEVANLQTQLSLSRLLQTTIQREKQYSLLPSDIGLENSSINTLVRNYNEIALRRSKLLVSVGENHPSLQSLNSQLERGRENILKTVEVYQRQIRTSLGQFSQVRNNAGDAFSQLPEKQKMLRSIERQQNIKERLYMLLLQKREEAAINYAVTAPSIKVIDYGKTWLKPIAPKKILVYPVFFLAGLLIPGSVLFLRFWLDSKIHGRNDVLKVAPEIPMAAEIPFISKPQSVGDANDRSVQAESFRILSTNINYQLPDKDEGDGHVIYVTSAVNGEGKTLMALNLAIAYASLNKSVLLVGCDLRKPRLHSYMETIKTKTGLSEFLNDPTVEWSHCIHDGLQNNPTLKVCPSGKLPANPPKLLSDKRFEAFLEKAKSQFEYVIIDTAPTILVTDTLLISKFADLTLFVLKAGQTDKRILEYAKNLHTSGKLNNMCYVLNGVGKEGHYGYNYGYGYGYSQESPKNELGLKPLLEQAKTEGYAKAVASQFQAFKKAVKSRVISFF